MKILQLMKHDLADIRDELAANYRALRKQDPAKTRALYRRLRRGMAIIERNLQENLYERL
jgi:cytochrome c553